MRRADDVAHGLPGAAAAFPRNPPRPLPRSLTGLPSGGQVASTTPHVKHDEAEPRIHEYYIPTRAGIPRPRVPPPHVFRTAGVDFLHFRPQACSGTVEAWKLDHVARRGLARLLRLDSRRHSPQRVIDSIRHGAARCLP
jgi:hypothetical protein